MYLDGIDESLITSSIFDPKLGAELLTDVSQAMDVTTFLSDNTAWIRFCNVFARILIITSDCVQDHYISPDEAFFQAAMLAVSTQLFLRSAWPVLLAASSKTSLSVRDLRAFTQLFSELDLSVLQFKALLTSNTLEWVELKDGETVDLDGDYMYWLYAGEVSSSLQETSSNMEDSHRMFGEVHFAKALEVFRFQHKTKNSKSNKVKEVQESATAVSETLTAGASGSVLLRISTPKLLDLMKHDDQLYDSINGLILLCMQEKLTRTFHNKAQEKQSNVYQPSFSSLDGHLMNKSGSFNVTTV
jgi:hypothetical protein